MKRGRPTVLCNGRRFCRGCGERKPMQDFSTRTVNGVCYLMCKCRACDNLRRR